MSKITQQSFWVPVYDAAKEGGLRSCTRGRVDILRGRLWCHLYDPRFVDDASRAVSFLYNPDDPRLVALAVFRGLDLGTEAGCLLPRQTDEQASCEGKRRFGQSQGSQITFLCVAKLVSTQFSDCWSNQHRFKCCCWSHYCCPKAQGHGGIRWGSRAVSFVLSYRLDKSL